MSPKPGISALALSAFLVLIGSLSAGRSQVVLPPPVQLPLPPEQTPLPAELIPYTKARPFVDLSREELRRYSEYRVFLVETREKIEPPKIKKHPRVS